MISKVIIKISKATIKVEFANSLCQKAVGLMFRPCMKPGTGMLFDFNKDQKPGIWMAFMRFPIDIIWMDSSKKIVDITENAKPWALQIFYPKKKARYVIEVPAGFCRKEKIEIGNTALFGENIK